MDGKTAYAKPEGQQAVLVFFFFGRDPNVLEATLNHTFLCGEPISSVDKNWPVDSWVPVNLDRIRSTGKVFH